jgi:phage terminase large subunit GpA-like protein
MTSITELEKKAYLAFKPPRKLSLSEWADEYAYLSAESSAEGGRWHTLPYQKAMMDAVTDPNIEQITVMKSARVGYSKILNHIIAYHIHQDPCPIMVVQPTIEDAAGYSKEEIAPMCRDTKCLKGLISDAKAKDSTNTILQKQFPGGTLSLVGANSARGFRRVSRRIVLFDETDGYPLGGAGTEGDQIKLGIARTQYYWNRKIVAGSTPTIKDFSRIERLFNQSDQRRYYVPCPKCGHMQYLRWPNMRWQNDDPETACYACEECSTLIPHSKKRWMVERGEWRKTAAGNGRHAGFHIWAGYSYSPNAQWSNLVEEFLLSKNDPEQLKTWINVTLGECWEDEYASKVGADALMERAAKEKYEKGTPPREVLMLSLGCDVQDDRLSMSVWGIGRNEEMYLVDRKVIYGTPSRPDLWKQMDEVLMSKYVDEDGNEMKIESAAIDTGGHYTHETYQYVRERSHLGLIGIKGVGLKGKPPLGKPTKVDINFSGKALRKGVKLFPVGVDVIKTTLHNRLKDAELGEGYLHFYPTITTDYFEELTAERQVLKYKHGFQERVWMKKNNARNEALDEMVYSYAAFCRFLQRYDRRTIWDQLEARKKPVKPKQESPLGSGRQKAAKKRSFVANW